MFKIKAGYNLELQTSETIKLFASTKQRMDKMSWKGWNSISVMQLTG